MDEQTINNLAKKIWDYHHLNQTPEKADCLLVLGNVDIRIAEYAADLYFEEWAPFIVFTGNHGNFTGNWDRPEAEVFADIAIKRGVPKDNILIERRSTNTGENILFAKELLQENNKDIQKILMVCSPVMERRAYAAFKKVWPEKEVIVTSPNISFEECPTKELPKDELIHVLVGWLQRIKVWAGRGYQVPQEIPSDVWDAYEKLVAAGYNKYLVK